MQNEADPWLHRGKGVASNQFPIEIGRRVKRKKKPSESWAKKNPPKGIGLTEFAEYEFITNIYFGKSGIEIFELLNIKIMVGT
jgi:hypothetical protein